MRKIASEVKNRWGKECPDLFKKLIKIGISIGVIGGTLATLPATATIGAHMVTIGIVTAAISKFTVK